MATIGGKYIIPKGIGTVRWYCNNKLNNVLYITESPFNILSANALAEYMKCDYVNKSTFLNLIVCSFSSLSFHYQITVPIPFVIIHFTPIVSTPLEMMGSILSVNMYYYDKM